MSKIYVVNVNLHASSLAKYHVVSGGAKGLTIHVERGAQIELVDPLTGFGPKMVHVKRSGAALLIAFEDGKLDSPDVIVENYFDDKDSSVVGQTENGQLIDYVPLGNDNSLLIGNLADGLGGTYELGHGIGSAVVAESGYGKFVAGLLGLGLLGGGGGGGGGKGAQSGSTTPDVLDRDNHAPVTPTLVVGDSDHDGRINAVGTAEPGSTVVVTWPDGSTSTTTTAADGSWSVESPTVQGSGTVSATATDGAGNTSPAGTVSYSDNQAPVAPTVVAGDADNDGRINAGGTAEPGSTVVVTWPDGSTSTTMAATDGSWSVESPTVQGSGTVSATATDGAGNTSPAGTVSYSDNQAPVAPTVVASDSDHDGKINAGGTAEPGSTVVVTWPDGSTSTTTAAADGSWSVESPTVQGSGTVSATATDGAGNTSPAGTVTCCAS